MAFLVLFFLGGGGPLRCSSQVSIDKKHQKVRKFNNFSGSDFLINRREG